MKLLRITAEHMVTGLPDLPAGPLFHADPKHPSFGEIARSGREIEAASEEINGEGTLIVPDATSSAVGMLTYVVDRLLGPGGCPWDQEQTHQSLKRTLIEEAHEVLDAIDSGSLAYLREELGDLLLQPVMHAQMEALGGTFSLEDVATGITDKLIRRHPHVFGDQTASTSEEVLKNWDAIKRLEKGKEGRGALDGIPRSLPALARALLVSSRAARQGFEWEDIDGIWRKLDEECLELKDAIEADDAEATASELGDVLFTVVNLARWLKVEPEDALRMMLDRFSARFERMEAAAEVPLPELSPADWEALWQQAKLSD